MAYLVDTGVLLRFTNTQDPQHPAVKQAVEALVSQNEELYMTTQNAAEFWNVSTRPKSDNGLGLPHNTVTDLLEQTIESICTVLVERRTLYGELKRLLAEYAVVGKQVHDARLVAMMLVWQIENVLTLNDRDFQRYAQEGITVVTPASITSAGPSSGGSP
jgi:predicted nucleic acid-binding protein